jgi:hypothetical protein
MNRPGPRRGQPSPESADRGPARVPVFLTMLPMMREIQADPGSGLLGASAWISRREIMIVQYWDTYDQLVAYATSSTKKHRPAWNNFNQRRGRAAATVGVFHETYVVAPDRMETIYDAMPPILLGSATRAVAVSRSRNSSRERLRGPSRRPPRDRRRAPTG